MMTAVDAAFAVVRALGMLGVVQAGGVALWLAVFPGSPRTDRCIAAAGLYAGVAATGLLVVELLMQPARMLGSFAGLGDAELLLFALGSSIGVAATVRVLGLGLIIAALARSTDRPAPARAALAVAGATVIAMSYTFPGHTSTSDLRWLLAPALAGHVLIVMLWVGGVFGLLVTARTARSPDVAVAAAAFSRLAVVLVPVILLLGIVMTWALLPDPTALFSGYGLLLLAKAGGFALLLAIAVINKWYLTPRLATRESAAPALRALLGIELLLLAAVLVLTTLLTLFFSPPPGG